MKFSIKILAVCFSLLCVMRVNASSPDMLMDSIGDPVRIILPEPEPERVTGWLNFNPVFRFTGGEARHPSTTIPDGLKEATVFTVYQHAAPAVEQIVWSLYAAGTGGPEVLTTRRFADVGKGKNTAFTLTQPDAVHVGHYYRNAAATPVGNYTINLGGWTDANFPLPAGPFRGIIGETRVYDYVLSPTQRNIVHTYYSLKYGVAQAGGGNTRYLDGRGEVIWSRSAETLFVHRLTGVGRDEITGLDQKQSRSAEAPDLLTIGLRKIAPTNAENDGGLNDGGYLLWADDDGPLAFAEPDGGPAGRRWKMTATGLDDDQELAVWINARRWPPLTANQAIWLGVDRSGRGDFSWDSTAFYLLDAQGETGFYHTSGVAWLKENTSGHFAFWAGSRVQGIVWKQGFDCAVGTGEGQMTFRVVGAEGALQLRLLDDQGREAQRWSGLANDVFTTAPLPAGDYELVIADGGGVLSTQTIHTCPPATEVASADQEEVPDYFLGPNPTVDGDFQLTLRLPAAEPMELTLTDYLGRVMDKTSLSQRDYLDHRGHLPVRGTYLLKVTAGMMTLNLPIIRQ